MTGNLSGTAVEEAASGAATEEEASTDCLIADWDYGDLV